jgi:hypothetical protein
MARDETREETTLGTTDKLRRRERVVQAPRTESRGLWAEDRGSRTENQSGATYQCNRVMPHMKM